MEQFTEEDIRFRGYAFTFPIFIAGTVYIIQRTVSEASIGSQPDKDKLALCRRFLQTVGPYYASAIDEDLLLGRLSSGSVTSASGVGESTGRTSSSTIEVLSDFVLSTPPMDAVDNSDFEMMWLEGLTVEEAKEWKMSPLFVLPVEKDMQSQADGQDVEVEEDADGGGVEEEHAFFNTDSGLKTFWMHPEKMASLEEATILSFEKYHFAFVLENQAFEPRIVLAAVDLAITQVRAQLAEKQRQREK
ncbi:hypothetical protein BGZ97_007584 [Linnemannia gamsii]|uniref:Uncharacterized protein n=1 Tax=Linnemannia gamsii TaxID=64522 RepID=A0A9P6QPX9_9FUNG|nr:hypothetical protein BGZ97_007584 [Linnemannia gamsii]